MHRLHLLDLFLLVLAWSVGTCCAQQQDDLQDLEGTPFLIDGVQYRDMLTISASQAVGTFAGRFQPQERQRINDRSRSPSNLQSTQFFSNTLSTPIGQPSWEGAIHYGEALHVRIPNTLAQDRVLADRDEDILTSEDKAPAGNIHTINGSGGSGGRAGFRSRGRSRGLSSRPRSRGLLNRVPAPAPAPTHAGAPAAFGNYQSVVGHGLSYSTGSASRSAAAASAYPAVSPSYSTSTSFAAAAPPPAAPAAFSPSPALYPAPGYAASSTAAPVAAVYDYGPSYAAAPAPAPGYEYDPYSGLGGGSSPRTVDYQIQVHHGDPGGSYSYSTFG